MTTHRRHLLTRFDHFRLRFRGAGRTGFSWTTSTSPKTRFPAPPLISCRGARSLSRSTSVVRPLSLFFIPPSSSARLDGAWPAGSGVGAGARAALDPSGQIRIQGPDPQGDDLPTWLSLLARHRSLLLADPRSVHECRRRTAGLSEPAAPASRGSSGQLMGPPFTRAALSVFTVRAFKSFTLKTGIRIPFSLSIASSLEVRQGREHLPCHLPVRDNPCRERDFTAPADPEAVSVRDHTR